MLTQTPVPVPTQNLNPGLLFVPETFGAFMRRTRQGKRMTLEQVAEALDTTHVTIQRYESGARYVSLEVAMRWADAISEPRNFVTSMWVEANGGELTYEQDPDAIPVPEGFNDDDPSIRNAASSAAQETYKAVVEAMRKARQFSPGTSGFGADRYENRGRSDGGQEETEEGDGADHGTPPGDGGAPLGS